MALPRLGLAWGTGGSGGRRRSGEGRSQANRERGQQTGPSRRRSRQAPRGPGRGPIDNLRGPRGPQDPPRLPLDAPPTAWTRRPGVDRPRPADPVSVDYGYPRSGASGPKNGVPVAPVFPSLPPPVSGPTLYRWESLFASEHASVIPLSCREPGSGRWSSNRRCPVSVGHLDNPGTTGRDWAPSRTRGTSSPVANSPRDRREGAAAGPVA